MTLEYSSEEDYSKEDEGYMPIAFTEEGEVAYYKPPDVEEMRALPPSKRRSVLAKLARKQRITSESGSVWMPDFLSLGRITLFIPAPPNAGKSFFAARVLDSLPEDFNVLLFTALTEEDENFKDLKQPLFRVKMTPETLSKINLESLRARGSNILLLFDDFDNIPKGRVLNEVQRILHDVLANGRAHSGGDDRNVHVIVTTHILNDYMKTKYITENCDYIAFFPQSTTFCQLLRLGMKVGLSQAQISALRASRERVCIMHKVSPLIMFEGTSIETI